MTRDEMYNELIHFVNGDYLDILSEIELTALYKEFFKEDKQ